MSELFRMGGFMMWPLTMTCFVVFALASYSTVRLFRPSAWADLKSKVFVDAILFGGGFVDHGGERLVHVERAVRDRPVALQRHVPHVLAYGAKDDFNAAGGLLIGLPCQSKAERSGNNQSEYTEFPHFQNSLS